MEKAGKYALGLIVFISAVAGVLIMVNRDKTNLLETNNQHSDEIRTELQKKDNQDDDSIELSFDKAEATNIEQSENESTVNSLNSEQNNYVDVQDNSVYSHPEEESDNTVNSSNDGKKRTVYIEGVGEVELGPNELDFLPAD